MLQLPSISTTSRIGIVHHRAVVTLFITPLLSFPFLSLSLTHPISSSSTRLGRPPFTSSRLVMDHTYACTLFQTHTNTQTLKHTYTHTHRVGRSPVFFVSDTPQADRRWDGGLSCRPLGSSQARTGPTHPCPSSGVCVCSTAPCTHVCGATAPATFVLSPHSYLPPGGVRSTPSHPIPSPHSYRHS